MGKRSDFLRVARDAYDTPAPALEPLLPYLDRATRFIEPCAGAGDLVRRLEAAGHICLISSDIEPRDDRVFQQDALTLHKDDCRHAQMFITNTPWGRKLLHQLIRHFLSLDLPAWLLIDANWMFTQQAAPFLRHCEKIVTIGRVRWIPDTPMSGKDDCAWFLFQPHETPTTFVGKPGKGRPVAGQPRAGG